MIKPLAPLMFMTVVIASCNSDKRIVELATTAADRQAKQNEEMSRLHREVAQGTRQLVEADAQAREEFTRVHQTLQSERSQLSDGWQALEEERKAIAHERRTESLIVPIAKALGVVLLTIVVIGFCWSIVVGVQRSDEQAELNELLISEITSPQSVLLPPPSQEPPALPCPEETAR